jgi:hypothetical protein
MTKVLDRMERDGLVKRQQDARDRRHSDLTLGCLSSDARKADECCPVIVVCKAWAFVWPQCCDQTNPVHKHISQTLRLVLSLHDIAGTHTGLFHVPEDRELILKTAVHWIAHYNWLAKWAQGQGLKRWGTVLKHHYVGHLALQSQWLHCRAGATYWDEDFIGAASSMCPRRQVGWLGALHLHCLPEVAQGNMAYMGSPASMTCAQGLFF